MRHKKLEPLPEESTQMDISSLIDCCFLLLLYFLVATTLVAERKLDMSMPSTSAPSEVKPLVDPGFVRITGQGTIYWGAGDAAIEIDNNPENHDLANLVEQLNTLAGQAKAVGTFPVVQLYVEGDALSQRLVDVVTALTKAGIEKVAMTDIKDD